MSWAYGQNSEGREIGYGVPATCDAPKCNKRIDRGIAYCCGDLDGVEGLHGCGHYYCGEHEMHHHCESFCGEAFCSGAQWHGEDEEPAVEAPAHTGGALK